MHKNTLRQLRFYILVGLIVLPFLFPLIWIVMCSLKTQQQIISIPPEWIFKPTLENYKSVFVENDFGFFLMNSSIIAFFSTLLSLVIGLPAAYTISRYNQKKLGVFLLVARLMPGIAFLIPWYIAFSKLRLTDTYFALITSHMLVSLPLVVWIMTSFIDDLPYELEEAAKVDGCTVTKTFLKIILPLSTPGVVTASTLSFIFSWNNFMFSLTLSASRTKTLPIAIYNFVSYAEISWGKVMAAAVVIIAPAILLTMIFQKYVIQGLTAGATKG
jgi:multiple sugar transport system permease protein